MPQVLRKTGPDTFEVIADTQGAFALKSSSDPGKIAIDPVTNEMSINPGMGVTAQAGTFTFLASQPLAGTAPAANTIKCAAADNAVCSVSATGLITFKKTGFHLVQFGRADCTDTNLWTPVLVSPSGCGIWGGAAGVPNYQTNGSAATTTPPWFVMVNTPGATVQLQWGYWSGSARTVSLLNVNPSVAVRLTV